MSIWSIVEREKQIGIVLGIFWGVFFWGEVSAQFLGFLFLPDFGIGLSDVCHIWVRVGKERKQGFMSIRSMGM